MSCQIVDRDHRAENNRRTVHFEEGRIVIMRRIHGVSMRVTMPVNKYDGIGVLLPNMAEGREEFSVMLVHTDPDLSVLLYQDCNPLLVDAAMAEWSQFFNLPILDGRPDCDQPVHHAPPARAVVGAVTLGGAMPQRRRGGTLAKRRPRYFARRKIGSAVLMEQVHRGEREIIARD
jgi:hypothetical protein